MVPSPGRSRERSCIISTRATQLFSLPIHSSSLAYSAALALLRSALVSISSVFLCVWDPALTMSGRGAKAGAARKKSVTKSTKAGLQFPVSRLARYLKKGRYAQRVGSGAPVYLAAVLEYLAAEVTSKYLLSDCLFRLFLGIR